MNVRIFSQVVCRAIRFAIIAAATLFFSSDAGAQSNGLLTDPVSGIVYQPVTKTVERPVVETRVESRQQTVYRPQTVTESRPETRTYYTPVVEYKWQPRVHGRWNPFRQPTVAYHHVPSTHWERRNDMVQRTTTRTEWVAEQRTVDVPQRIVRMQRDQKVEYEPVGRVAPQGASPPGASESIASRLRPLAANTRVIPMGQRVTRLASSAVASPGIAASTVGRMTSDPPRRSPNQSGLRSTNLSPNVRGQALPPVSSGMGIATMPTLPFMR